MATIYANVIRENRALITDLTMGADVLVAGQFGFAYNDKCLVVCDISGAFHEIYITDTTIDKVKEELTIKEPVDTIGDLPNAPDNGDLAYVIGEQAYYFFNGTEWELLNKTNTIEELSDTSITSLANGQMLQYNGSNWVNVTYNFDTIADLNITDLSDNDILVYDSASQKWVNQSFDVVTGIEPDSFSIGSHLTTAFDLLVNTDVSDLWYAPDGYYDDPDAYAESDNFDDTTMIFTATTAGRYFFSAYGSLRTNAVLSIVDQELGILRINSSDNITWKYTTFAKINDATTTERTPYAVSCVMDMEIGDQAAFAALAPITDFYTTFRFSGFKLAGIGGGNGDAMQDAYDNGHEVDMSSNTAIKFKENASGEMIEMYQADQTLLSGNTSTLTANKAVLSRYNTSGIIEAFTRLNLSDTLSEFILDRDNSSAGLNIDDSTSQLYLIRGEDTLENIDLHVASNYALLNMIANSGDSYFKTGVGADNVVLDGVIDNEKYQFNLQANGSSSFSSFGLVGENASCDMLVNESRALISSTYDNDTKFKFNYDNTVLTSTLLITSDSTGGQELTYVQSGDTEATQISDLSMSSNDGVNFNMHVEDDNVYLKVAHGSNTIEIDPDSGINMGAYTIPIFDGTDGQALITDGNGGLTWGDAGSGGGGDVEEAPIDGTPYARQDSGWVAADVGEQGPAGVDGVDGVDGAQGIQGETGIQGEQGIQGIQGIQGETGADSTVAGPAGADGTDGTDGADGADGFSSVVVVTALPTIPDANTLYVII